MKKGRNKIGGEKPKLMSELAWGFLLFSMIMLVVYQTSSLG